MTQSTFSPASVSEFANFRATFPAGLWATALLIACLLTGFVGAVAEPESSWVQEQTAPAAAVGQAG